jgi:large subunit ribosomal protein L34
MLYLHLSPMQRLTKSKKIKRIRKHGFLVRMKSHGGQKTIKRRRDQGRKELAVSL